MQSTENRNIREATPKDIPGMMNLIKELAILEKEPDAITVSLKEFEEAGFGPNPAWKALVAESFDGKQKEDVLCGIALYYIRYSTWKGKMLYLEDIIVRQHYRGRGIGSALIRRLVELARQEELSGICWQVLGWNASAISFYEKIPGVSFDKEWVNVKILF